MENVRTNSHDFVLVRFCEISVMLRTACTVSMETQKNVEAAILFLDQEKAFDRVDHQFLLKTLKHLNFGDNFISWIEIILKDISSQIKINGFCLVTSW